MLILSTITLLSLNFLIFNILFYKYRELISRHIVDKFRFADIFFIELFAFEQILFMISYFFYNGDIQNFCVGVFGVVVITTAIFQKYISDLETQRKNEANVVLSKEIQNVTMQYYQSRRSRRSSS